MNIMLDPNNPDQPTTQPGGGQSGSEGGGGIDPYAWLTEVKGAFVEPYVHPYHAYAYDKAINRADQTHAGQIRAIDNRSQAVLTDYNQQAQNLAAQQGQQTLTNYLYGANMVQGAREAAMTQTDQSQAMGRDDIYNQYQQATTALGQARYEADLGYTQATDAAEADFQEGVVRMQGQQANLLSQQIWGSLTAFVQNTADEDFRNAFIEMMRGLWTP